MPQADNVTKLLAGLDDLARSVRRLHSRILDMLLSEARNELAKYDAEKDQRLPPVSLQKKTPSSRGAKRRSDPG
jgi:hypothetical protein